MSRLKTLIARLHQHVSNRRAAPRYATHLEKSLVVYVHLLNAKGKETAETSPRREAKIVGYTRDLSETGLGIIVPDIRLGGVTIVNPQRPLRILLGIPPEPVEIRATPARYVKLDEGELDGGYLVGAQIVEMSAPDRARYLKYLNSFAVEEI